MKILVEIDTDDLLNNTSAQQDEEIADSLIANASCDAVVNAVIDKGLAEEVLEALSEADRENLFSLYGYSKTIEQ
ncbi:MAG: hypothetical protein J6X18_01160 [Bacteroidales bacterium]|nr:hypothetical protein [Bacteroidales bacterium]